MIRAVDHHELLRLRRPRVELADVFERTQLVTLAVNEELRLHAARDRLEIVAADRRGDGDERRHSRVLSTDGQRYPRAEGHARRPHLRPRIVSLHVVECGPEVVHLAGTVREAPGARARATE